jgi:hypothetical protein
MVSLLTANVGQACRMPVTGCPRRPRKAHGKRSSLGQTRAPAPGPAGWAHVARRGLDCTEAHYNSIPCSSLSDSCMHLGEVCKQSRVRQDVIIVFSASIFFMFGSMASSQGRTPLKLVLETYKPSKLANDAMDGSSPSSSEFPDKYKNFNCKTRIQSFDI